MLHVNPPILTTNVAQSYDHLRVLNEPPANTHNDLPHTWATSLTLFQLEYTVCKQPNNFKLIVNHFENHRNASKLYSNLHKLHASL